MGPHELHQCWKLRQENDELKRRLAKAEAELEKLMAASELQPPKEREEGRTDE